ncbi:GEM-like protein 4 [Bienertia sinuspersici]
MEAANAFKSIKCMFDDQNKLLPAPSRQHVDGCNPKNNNKMTKGKLSLREKILQVGRVEKVYRGMFEVSEGEELLKASKCSLFTTAGALAGRLFISTDKLAFCSDKAIAKYTSPSGETLRYRYKVVIPLRKIKIANQSENMKKPSNKYLHVVTTDDFEFWFMGFVNYNRSVKCLQQALS